MNKRLICAPGRVTVHCEIDGHISEPSFPDAASADDFIRRVERKGGVAVKLAYDRGQEYLDAVTGQHGL